MALIKEIELSNGATVNYHRVVSVINITNHASIIEIASYTSKAKREEEKTALGNGGSMDIFIDTKNIPLPYDENMNVVSAYEYLKTIEKYSDAQDD